jgi:alpha-L-rhamnosidase
MPKRLSIPHRIRLAGRTRDPRTGLIPVAYPEPTLGWTVAHVGDSRPTGAELELGDPLSGTVRRARHDRAGGVDVRWPFPPLAAGSLNELRIRLTDPHGGSGPWSEAEVLDAQFRHDDAGSALWRAPFIAGADDERPIRLRAEFEVSIDVRRATLRLTAFGAVRAEIDGAGVSDDVLGPGWTSFRQRLFVDAYDLTPHLSPGRHALGLELAGGWYTESYGFGEAHRRVYGTAPAASAELELTLADGSVRVLVTDDTWRTSDQGPLRASGIYAGESYDARRAQPGWSAPGYDDREWWPARVVTSTVVPEARSTPPVRRIDQLAVAEVLPTSGESTLLDFGQNVVGRLRITARGPAGGTVTVRHAEVLEDGELALRPLRRAEATDTLTLAGTGDETWEPEFTFHGFRYASIDTSPGVDVDPSVVAVVVGTDLERIGFFRCSDPRLERLHENVVWSTRGNFLSIPTDCPQRDERLGWTGDVQVFAPTASFLYDVEAFLGSWLRDLALEQDAHDGVVPVVVPWVLDEEVVEVAAWGDAATVVPSVLYERFGALSILERQYSSMRGWCDRLLNRAGPRATIEGGFQFGDWLDPAAPPDDPFAATTEHDLVANAYFIRSLDLTARASRVLERHDEAARLEVDADNARVAFIDRFVNEQGDRLSSNTPTAYSLALCFGLIPEEARARFGERLAWLVRENDHRIATGFVGTPLILDALSSTGHADDAVDLLLQTESPSWLSPVLRGATTIWERWDSMLPDGRVNPGEMTSFNHYALGAVADWLHRVLAGLTPTAPGYRELRIAPLVTMRLDHVEARTLTPFGEAVSGWTRGSDGGVTVAATIPAGTRAEVVLPDGTWHSVGPGRHAWTVT